MRVVYSPLDAVTHRPGEPGPRGRLLRHRLRDDGARQRAGRDARAGARRHELLRARVARAGAARDHRHPAVARATACRGSSAPATSARSWATASTRRSPQRYRVPIVITGFEPVDLLEGVLATVRQLEAGEADVENQYARVVQPRGQRRGAAARLVGLRGLRPQVARHRHASRRAASGCARSYRELRRRAALRGGRDGDARAGRLHQRPDPARPEEAARLPGVRRRRARPSTRSAPPWSRPRAPAPRTTRTAGTARTVTAGEGRRSCARRARAPRSRSSSSAPRPTASRRWSAPWPSASRAAAGSTCMGNGGSATDAQHVAVEFFHPIIEKRKPLPALALTRRHRRCSPRSPTTATSPRSSPTSSGSWREPGDMALAHQHERPVAEPHPGARGGARARAPDHRLHGQGRRPPRRRWPTTASSCRRSASTASRRRT